MARLPKGIQVSREQEMQVVLHHRISGGMTDGDNIMTVMMTDTLFFFALSAGSSFEGRCISKCLTISPSSGSSQED